MNTWLCKVALQKIMSLIRRPYFGINLLESHQFERLFCSCMPSKMQNDKINTIWDNFFEDDIDNQIAPLKKQNVLFYFYWDGLSFVNNKSTIYSCYANCELCKNEDYLK
ncbi:unnamed protein product [Paramecium pentaurelia]|uniref:Uncharacterized protein n=1 Tax=Paramecium pentaurelia TaxID=43138 RepID=A0A8S1XVR1_9CILI|nr:unnamed protein product [Paramecium pentaurelia]CAD8205535.1 unnamed protein product [Paramecium pentaurelia]